jgi:hypothetical protein
MKEDYVLQALKSLAENDQEREAPPQVEARLLAAFQSRRVHHGWRWGIAALAAGLIVGALLWPNRAPKPAVASTAQPVVAAPLPAQPATAATVERPPRKPARKIAPLQRPKSHEVVTDFFPLMNPEPAFERGQMLRVQLPAAAMRMVGLPVREEHLADPIQADVLVGEEGMARAIRFVRFDVQ